MEDIICAYACPTTDWNSTPFFYPDIEYFKNKFREVFNEMELYLGRKEAVVIDENQILIR